MEAVPEWASKSKLSIDRATMVTSLSALVCSSLFSEEERESEPSSSKQRTEADNNGLLDLFL